MDSVSGGKPCVACGNFTLLHLYQKHSSNKDGLESRCNACIAKQVRERRAKNPEAVKEKDRAYYALNAEKKRAQARERRLKNGARINALRRAQYQADPDRTLQSNRRWWAENPEAIKAKHQRRRARKRDAVGTHGADDIKLLFKLQNGLCHWCHAPLEADFHIDHRIALSVGGTNDPSNLCLACPTCNCSKQAKMPWEFMEGRLL